MARSSLGSGRKRLLGLALVIAAVPLIVACNAIIGLSDFEKTECNGGGKCSDGSVPPIDGDKPDVLVDGDIPDVRGANAVSWAAWPMPNNPVVDGGTDLPNPIKYKVLDANRLQDLVTNLVWRRATLPATSYAAATTACDGLANGPWRLPKRIELVTLLDFTRKGGVLIGPEFTNVANETVWSSSEYRTVDTSRPTAEVGITDKFWTVDFAKGNVDALNETLKASVLCVGATK